MKKILLTFIIMCLLIAQIGGYCKANTIDNTIEVLNEGELPFYYQGEEKTNYKMLKVNDYVLYLTNRNTQTIDSELAKEELSHNEKFDKILKYGYDYLNKSLEELGVNNDFEAYVATQEALFYLIEHKNINNYHAENEQGQRIINAMVKIIQSLEYNDVELIEQTPEWIEIDGNNQYKEYNVKLKEEVYDVSIGIVNGKGSNIIGKDGQTITNLKQNDVIRVVIPQNINQTFFVNVDYKIMRPILYTASSNTSTTEYIVSKLYEKDEDYQLQIEIQNGIDVVINNYEQETKQPIEGNEFEILDEQKHTCLSGIVTDINGQIECKLQKGKYYLKQVSTKVGELQKELVPIEVKGTEKKVKLNIYNTDLKQEELTTNEKEINVTEENKNINENHIKNIMNINTTNIHKEIVNKTNETNLNNVNHFINTINRKSILNLTKENYYQNQIREEYTENQILPGENLEFQTDRLSYENQIDNIKLGTIDIPNLPVASKE